ncbi:unnamed protein product, partial [Owenia fusiformis]
DGSDEDKELCLNPVPMGTKLKGLIPAYQTCFLSAVTEVTINARPDRTERLQHFPQVIKTFGVAEFSFNDSNGRAIEEVMNYVKVQEIASGKAHIDVKNDNFNFKIYGELTYYVGSSKNFGYIYKGSNFDQLCGRYTVKIN